MPILRYNYFLHADLQGANGVILRNINVPFQPEEMIVKYSIFTQDAAQPTSHLVSDIVDNEILTPICDGVIINNDVIFKINKPINGTYKFMVKSVLNVNVTTFTGIIYVLLEFRKYD